MNSVVSRPWLFLLFKLPFILFFIWLILTHHLGAIITITFSITLSFSILSNSVRSLHVLPWIHLLLYWVVNFMRVRASLTSPLDSTSTLHYVWALRQSLYGEMNDWVNKQKSIWNVLVFWENPSAIIKAEISANQWEKQVVLGWECGRWADLDWQVPLVSPYDNLS